MKAHAFITAKKTMIVITIVYLWSVHSEAQVNWTKSPANPIMLPGSDWQSSGFPFVFLMENNDSLNLWFTASEGVTTGADRIGYGSSADGINFILHQDPVFEPSGGNAFDSQGVFGASVLFDGSLYRMWYNGYNTQPYYIGKMETGLATSTDGLSWSRYSSDPVLATGLAGSWDNFWAYSSTVLFDDGIYKMWYTGSDGFKIKIGYATSPDGISWTKDPGNPVLDPDLFGLENAQNPRVLHDGNLYEMWFNSSNPMTSEYDIYYLTSQDGINWTDTPVKVISTGSAGTFDDLWVWHPFVIKSAGVYRMWYTGFDGLAYSVGFASDSTLVGIGNEKENRSQENNSLLVYPNPAANTAHVSLFVESPGRASMNIYTLQGFQLYTDCAVEFRKGINVMDIDVSKIPNGLYVLECISGTDRKDVKLVIAR